MFQAQPHSRLVDGETDGGDAEQPARRHDPRQPAGQRDHDDLGDQIAGLHPGDLVGAGRQPAADVGQRGGDDLDVQQRDEEADAHAGEGEDLVARRELAGRGGRRGQLAVRSGVLTACRRWSTAAVTDRPGRSCPSAASSPSSRMRTGTRCTILVKLPVAFSGGSTLNCGAGRRRQAGDMAREHLARQHVGLDRHRHARAHAGELALLEVGIDPQATRRHHATSAAHRPSRRRRPARCGCRSCRRSERAARCSRG